MSFIFDFKSVNPERIVVMLPVIFIKSGLLCEKALICSSSGAIFFSTLSIFLRLESGHVPSHRGARIVTLPQI